MDFTVVAGAALGEADAARWRALLDDAGEPASPFLTPTFTRVVAAHRPDTRVVVVHDGGGVAGYLPYQRTGERVGLPVGAHLNDVQGMVGDPRGLDARALVRAMGVRDWRFDHLLARQAAFAPYVRDTARSPVIDVSAGVDAYEAAVRAHSRGVLQTEARMHRKLERDVGPVTFEWDTGSHDLLARLLRWKSEQYVRTGAVDVLAPQWTRDVLHHLLDVREEECGGRLSVLRAGDRVVALHFGLAGPRILHYWFPVYDPELAAYQPGIQLLLAIARNAPGHGVGQVDLGMGEHAYKLRVATGAYGVAQGQVPARGDAYRAALLARHPGWARRRLADTGRRLAGRVSARSGG